MSNIIQIIRPKKKKHNFHLQIWRTPGRLLDPYRLDVCEFANPMSSQFSPMAGPFHSPEGYPGIGSHHAVYEHHASLQIVDKALALLLVVCPGTGPQSKA